MSFVQKLLVGLLAISLIVGLAACGGETTKQDQQFSKLDRKRQNRTAYEPKNDVEYNNYNRAQKLYDSPNTIIWCSTTWGNASAPIVTVPVAGKLTSSSVSFFPNQVVKQYSNSGTYYPELPSVDGMFHGSPPPYRYGFTPGGQYVDFFNMPTFCTTALTKFQRQVTQVSLSIDSGVRTAQGQAQEALQAGGCADDPESGECRAARQEAQRILEGALGATG
ncbi:MAG: hypothetical protein WD603_01060 [Patescibacteria group bacterium]